MKYQQPYGISDPNASYINGNPSTGTMGSIPPAASIEHPMREIVNMITHAGGTPNDADLHQLAKAIQSGKVIYAIDAGTTNAYQITADPPLTVYTAGLRLSLKILNANTGASTLNVNALGAQPITYPNGTPLKGNEMLIGAIATVIYDGAKFQLQNVASNILAAPLIYYVNDAIGSDTLYDGTTPTVSGLHGPFRTHNRAIQAAQSWNQNGYNVTIYTADGVYPPITPAGGPNGAGGINIVGNVNNPAAVLIHSTVNEAIFFGANGYGIYGMKVQSDSVSGAPFTATGVRLISCATWAENMEFGACAQFHMYVEGAARLSFAGADLGQPNAFIRVTGDAPVAHIHTAINSLVHIPHTKLVTVGNLNIGYWVEVNAGSVSNVAYSTQTMGGTVTGTRYLVAGNGVISNGGGPNYYPGTIAGIVATGGQYI